ncbi:MAG: MFS transporter [Hyphomicrobium sp.]|uniref:MFS transporter n=1 Tax=Hyphomicrobium sp. TaxID=82 RepID=UPI0013266B4C|nr:MFS transporter [Hyphomicrobium sp.]KAB2943599.1 MAG: MFS transporter [Hyphomicrobium sp.]MBZ0209669.1 MFS transporter [Hyphomicrobium sp.]
MPEARAQASSATKLDSHPGFVLAWLFCLVFFFLTYVLRSAPGVMIPELSTAFGLTALGVSTLVGLYYYTLAGFSIVAGASLDRFGAKLPLPLGVFTVAIGSGLFVLGGVELAGTGRLLQGAGSAFAFTGAVYLAVHGFSARRLATVIGFTQAAGLLGGFAGQFIVGALVQGPIAWQSFWPYAGILIGIIAMLLLIVTPGSHVPVRGSFWSMFSPYKVILRNPQSYLCGIIAGLLFMPTTIGDMIWGVPFLRQGLGIEAGDAVARSSMVPLGWVMGAPLLGYVADWWGRRKPVLAGGIVLMLVSGIGVVYLHQYLSIYIGALIFGIGSGAAVIPYTIAKEANPDSVKGSTTGAINFLVFSFSALLAPVFGLALQQFSGAELPTLPTFHQADLIWAGAIILALILTFFLRETGAAAKPA